MITGTWLQDSRMLLRSHPLGAVIRGQDSCMQVHPCMIQYHSSNYIQWV